MTIGFRYLPFQIEAKTAYDAVLARAATLSYTTPSTAQQQKHILMIAYFMQYGLWDEMDVFWLPAQNGSSEFGTLNWKTPASYQVTLVNTPTWTSNQGFKGNGSTSYVNTNFNCATNAVKYTLNNASRAMWVHTAATTGAYFEGILNQANNCMSCLLSAVIRINQGGTSLSGGQVDMTGTGLRGLARTSATDVVVTVGATKFSRTATSSSIASGSQVAGARVVSSGELTNQTWSCYTIGSNKILEGNIFNNIISAYMAAP